MFCYSIYGFTIVPHVNNQLKTASTVKAPVTLVRMAITHFTQHYKLVFW
jgi:hypothetical protein